MICIVLFWNNYRAVESDDICSFNFFEQCISVEFLWLCTLFTTATQMQGLKARLHGIDRSLDIQIFVSKHEKRLDTDQSARLGSLICVDTFSPYALTHSHTMTPFDASGKEAF